MYLVDGQEYVRLDDVAGAKPTIRDSQRPAGIDRSGERKSDLLNLVLNKMHDG